MCCSWEADSDRFWRKGQREMKITFFNIFITLLKCKPVKGVRFVLIYDGNEEQFLH